MTKREWLLGLAARQDQLIIEMNAAAKTMTLSSSHEMGNAIAIAAAVSSRLMKISKRPDMARSVEFVERV